MSWFRRAALIALLIALAAPAPAAAQDDTTQFFKIYTLIAGADTTLKVTDFNVDGTSGLECHRITKIGYKNGAGSPADTIWSAQPNGWFPNPLPPSSDDAFPLLLRRMTDIARDRKGAPSDSAVIRVKVMTGATFYLYMWGE